MAAPLPPAVSVVIPAFGAERYLARCLSALAEQDAPPDRFEIIVVDDASPDAGAALAERAGARVLRHSTNRGAAAARNTGAAAAHGEVLLFLDADVVPAPTLVSACAAAFAAGEAAATGRYEASPANAVAFARYKALWTWYCWERTGARTGESGHLQGALAAVRRDVFNRLGGFDETYEGGSVEDYEFSIRLVRAGHRIAFCEGMTGQHHFPGFGTVARNYWDRTRMWARLRPQDRSFSSGQANRRSATAAVCAAVAATGHVAWPLFPPLLPAALLADAAWLAASGPFLAFVARREGLAFAAYSAAVHFSLNAVVGAAAATTPLGRGSRS